MHTISTNSPEAALTLPKMIDLWNADSLGWRDGDDVDG
jgi:hypothetical protein